MTEDQWAALDHELMEGRFGLSRYPADRNIILRAVIGRLKDAI